MSEAKPTELLPDKFIATIADGLRHAIRDHGPITKELIGSAAKRVYSRIRGTKYDPNTRTPSPAQADLGKHVDGWLRALRAGPKDTDFELGVHHAAEFIKQQYVVKTWDGAYYGDVYFLIGLIARLRAAATPASQADGPDTTERETLERKCVLDLIERFQQEPRRAQGTINALEWLRRQIAEGNHRHHNFEPPTTGFAKNDECFRCGLPPNAIMHVAALAASQPQPTESSEGK